MSELAELYKALVEAQKAIGKAKLDGQNPHFRSKYASLGEIIDVAKTINEFGLAFVQLPYSTDTRMGVETKIVHVSGAEISGKFDVPVGKADAQGFGSALTYIKRYGLAAMLGIVADEDDDGNDASRTRPQPQKQDKPPEQWKATDEALDLIKKISAEIGGFGNPHQEKVVSMLAQYRGFETDQQKCKDLYGGLRGLLVEARKSGKAEATQELELGLANPDQVKTIKAWLTKHFGQIEEIGWSFSVPYLLGHLTGRVEENVEHQNPAVEELTFKEAVQLIQNGFPRIDKIIAPIPLAQRLTILETFAADGENPIESDWTLRVEPLPTKKGGK